MASSVQCLHAIVLALSLSRACAPGSSVHGRAPIEPAIEWRRLPSLPVAKGLAGSFAGVSHGALLVAGGTNFPDSMPWEGGRKVWYDTIFVLERPDAKWRAAGRLPRPLGYGVCVTYRDGLVCVGGSDAGRHYADAFRLEWRRGRVQRAALPPLPTPVADACGALVRDTLFVAGGQERPDARAALSTVYQMNLAARNLMWRRVDGFPGDGRILAAAVALDGAFWVVGGASLSVGSDGAVRRHYLADAYRYDPRAGWRRMADLPHALAAAPSPSPVGASGLYIIGCDDGTRAGFRPPRNHPGFNPIILRYDAATDRWATDGRLPAARVTTPCVEWRGRWVIPGGEVRPGVRSPEVWSMRVDSHR